MHNKRLKLYNDSLELVISKKTKKQLRQIAFKHHMTMSEYVRNLIEIELLKKHKENLKTDLIHSSELMASKSLRGELDV